MDLILPMSFSLFFFIIALAVVIDIIADFGDEYAMRILHRVPSNDIWIAILVLIVLGLVRVMPLLTSHIFPELMAALFLASVLYTSMYMTDGRVHSLFLVGAYILAIPYWGWNPTYMAELVGIFLVLRLANHFREHLYKSVDRLILVTAVLSAMLWIFVGQVQHLDVLRIVEMTTAFSIFMLIGMGHDYMLTYRRGRNRQYRYSTNHDGLTDARSLVLFRKDYSTYQMLMQSEKQPLHLAMLDIDHFKKINDTYGHLVGNEVLIRFVKDLSAYLEAMPYYCGVYRTGGEEFSILLYSVDDTEARAAIDAYVERVKHLMVTTINPDLRLTLSIGMTRALDDGQELLQELVSRADKNLYAAKEGGRNRIVESRVPAPGPEHHL